MPKLAEQIALTGNVVITVNDVATGKMIARMKRKNLVVLAGRNLVRDLLNGPTQYVTHLAVGTSATAISSTQTALVAEVFRDQITQRITSDGQLRLKYYLSSTSANGNTLQEAGLFNAASAGTMFARVATVAIAKTASITITYDWSINIGAA